LNVQGQRTIHLVVFLGLVIHGHHVHKVLAILSDGSDGYEEAGMKFLEDASAHLAEHIMS
jgi:hypothetical protein